MNEYLMTNQTITLAQLVEAMADGQLQASRDDEYYTVRVSDVSKLMRMLNEQPIPMPQRDTYTESYTENYAAGREFALAI